jgi:hypothetical protein
MGTKVSALTCAEKDRDGMLMGPNSGAWPLVLAFTVYRISAYIFSPTWSV